MQYHLDTNGQFIINDYQQAKPFSNFFPGVAGIYGIPMWAFFVNRGQGVSSFGIESKDRAILEFLPANKAYRSTTLSGFRTFLKVQSSGAIKHYEPFSNPLVSPYKVRQRMMITSHDLTIEETNTTLGIRISVNYFTIPEEPFAGLVRRVSIENISKKALKAEIIDGMPMINPYGLKDWLAKNMSRTVEAWVGVLNVARKAPFYQLKVEVADTPQVTHIEEGNFYFGFDADTGKLLDPIVEAAAVFGQSTDFIVPETFYGAKSFKVPVHQQTANRTPSAMVAGNISVNAGKSKTLVAVVGFAHDLSELNRVVTKAVKKGYIEAKAQRNKAIIEDIKNYCFTHSASQEFNQYCGQNFLDNILRGGLPVSFNTASGPVAINVYSRKHGDPERDYNFFTLAPTYLSQGNGNYRDVNQNRRNDVWFNKDVRDSVLINFMNLGQADGYNPLIVKGLAFAVKNDHAINDLIKTFAPQGDVELLRSTLKKGFMPGELLKLISRRVPVKGNPQEFLSKVLAVSEKNEQADFGEGYWSDHWTYNLDLIERFLALYPETLKETLLDKKNLHFYFSDVYVLPRDKRYIKTPYGVRQYHSLEEHDKNVKAKEKGNKLRMRNGEGDVYTTTLLTKLLCVLANKSASLDPSGIGVEMEANRPNWYDALNGLPGLLGSSINETFEVKRLAGFVLNALDHLHLDSSQRVHVFNELADFIEGLSHVATNAQDSLEYWKKSNDLKEHYRQLIRLGIEGKERALAIGDIKKFLSGIIAVTERGIAKGRSPQGLWPTYFYHEVTQFEDLDKNHKGEHHVRPLSFKRHDLPYFLEGPMHAMRVEPVNQAPQLYKAVQKSALYDKALKMYKVNTSLGSETEEIGRTRIFPSGWLENESVWLHMEYKYLLEVLRRGLFKEFFADAQNCLIPFLDPARYGRSILENSSFIVSSAHEDKKLHGQGFVARLSGSTAEFIHIWLLMNTGLKPFVLNDRNELALELSPILPSWLFTESAAKGFVAKTYAFKLLNSTLVVYHNPRMKDTFGANAVVPDKIKVQYKGGKTAVEVNSGRLEGRLAADVRDGKIERLDVILN